MISRPSHTRRQLWNLFPKQVERFRKHICGLKPESTKQTVCSLWRKAFVCADLTVMFPPPGEWLTLSREPTLDWAFSLKFILWDSIFTSPPPAATRGSSVTWSRTQAYATENVLRGVHGKTFPLRCVRLEMILNQYLNRFLPFIPSLN